MKRTKVAILALAIVALFVVACQPKATEPDACTTDRGGCAVFTPGTTIKIGYAGPMVGEYSAFGTDISQGGQIAINDFGSFEGWSFELLTEDTGGSPEGGAAVANKYVSESDVVAIAGHTFSGSTASAIPIYDAAYYPMLSPSATNPDLTAQGSAVFNRIPFTDQTQGEKAGEYLYNTLGLRNLAVMHDGQDYGKGLAEIVRDQFTSLGGNVVAFEAITPGETDYSAPLAAIAANSPDGIFYGGYDADAAVLVNQMSTSGLEGVTFFSDDGVYGQNFLDLTDGNSEGVYATSLIPPSSPEKDAFDAAFEAAYGRAPGVLSAYTYNGYDVVAALIHAVEQVAIQGDDGNLYVPRGALVDAVRGLSGFDGLTGTITCNDVGECNTAGPIFYVVQNGQWVQAP